MRTGPYLQAVTEMGRDEPIKGTGKGGERRREQGRGQDSG